MKTLLNMPVHSTTWVWHLMKICLGINTNQRLGLLRRIKVSRTSTHLPNTFSLLNSSTFWLWWHYIGLQEQHSTDERSPITTKSVAAKLILDKPKYSSATEALKGLKWKNLDHRRHPYRFVFIFSCLHKIIDFNFNFRENNAFHHCNTRQSKNLHLSAPKTNWAKQKVTYQAALDFNLLSYEIQETESILLFEKKVERVI